MLYLWLVLLGTCIPIMAQVKVGCDCFFEEGHVDRFRDKRIGVITNQTGVNSKLEHIVDLCAAAHLNVVALFAPEHGFQGQMGAGQHVASSKEKNRPIYSLHGKVRRPTDEMLQGIDLLIYDIQDIGVRSYTYTTSLFYIMEEAAKRGIAVIVLDRPNPINGHTLDGPMLDAKWRSFIGYINVPYCYGMTIGELALYFNEKYQIGCALEVIPMKGWKRSMSYRDTGLTWIPTSPNIPEPDTPLFYASTGILGELSIVSIGIGYTLPFKVVGAPWIVAQKLAEQLNDQKLPGVRFIPFFFRPLYGLYKNEDCQGVKIIVTDPQLYRPVAVQYMLLGILKTLYPKEITQKVHQADTSKRDLFCKATGGTEVLKILEEEKYIAWKLILFQKAERDAFSIERKKFLLYGD